MIYRCPITFEVYLKFHFMRKQNQKTWITTVCMFKQILFEWLFDFATKIFHTMQRGGPQAISQHWCMYIKSLYSKNLTVFCFILLDLLNLGVGISVTSVTGPGFVTDLSMTQLKHSWLLQIIVTYIIIHRRSCTDNCTFWIWTEIQELQYNKCFIKYS